MKIEARKKSTDPLQEGLREKKALWNKGVSEFISDLLNFKKMMNGWPSKFHMERSFIKDPIPSDPATILGVLASDFQDLAQKGNNIIEQQLEYSKNRKQKQTKQTPNVVSETPPSPNLTQQLAANLDYQLVAEGSNPLTRFYSSLKGPWFGGSTEARARKYRLSMLRTSAILTKEFKRLESSILGSSAESIFISGRILFQIENHMRFITNALGAFNLQSGNPTAQVNSLENVNKLLEDFRKNYLNFTDLDKNLVDKLSTLMLNFSPANDEEKIKMSPEITSIYQAILADANQKHGTKASTFKDILLSKSASLETISQNIVNKWLGKIKHNIVPFDKTSAIRLDISKASEQSRSILDKLMNALENSINESEVVLYIEELNKKIAEIKILIRPLEATIQNKMFDKTFVDLLQTNKITDYPTNLTDEQKKHLSRMLQTRQFRDITHNYTRT